MTSHRDRNNPYDDPSQPRSTVSEDRLVVVDDDEAMARLLADVLKDEGYEVDAYTDPKKALDSMLASPPALLITDMRMGTYDGMRLMEAIKAAHPTVPVILVTAFGSIDLAIEATRRGAYHFITKPFRLKEVLLIVERALGHRRMERENVRLREQVDRRYRFGGIVGKSRAMQQVFSLIERVAQANSNVLVLGESGTGKELVARAVHHHSPRAEQPFIAVNCSALPEGLLESELFGHVRGAFTGAHRDKIGLFQQASKGTLFLDEIGDMPLPLQAKLLRAIQERKIRPVGSNKEITVDTRIVAATHANLREEARSGRFREDLYYRLSVIPIELPPLRDRIEDIPLLVNHFIDRVARGLGVRPKSVDHPAMNALMRMRWEGNVRELENVIERAYVLSRGNRITVEDLPQPRGHEVDARPAAPAVAPMPPTVASVDTGGIPASVAPPEGLAELDGSPETTEQWPTLKDVELRYIVKVLAHTRGNKEEAATILEIDRRTLYRWRSRHNLDAIARGEATADFMDY